MRVSNRITETTKGSRSIPHRNRLKTGKRRSRPAEIRRPCRRKGPEKRSRNAPKGSGGRGPGARRGAVKTVGIERWERFSGMPADRTTDTRGSDRTTEIRRIRGDIRSESAEERKIRNIQGVETRRSGNERAGRQIRRFAETSASERDEELTRKKNKIYRNYEQIIYPIHAVRRGASERRLHEGGSERLPDGRHASTHLYAEPSGSGSLDGDCRVRRVLPLRREYGRAGSEPSSGLGGGSEPDGALQGSAGRGQLHGRGVGEPPSGGLHARRHGDVGGACG